MATYTENYNLVKPTMAESADIRTINGNMDSVDNIMHATQVSLAPAYDQNETYNTGDIVMYEFLMYECLDDDVTGTWDATKWQRTTAGEHGGGGGSADYVELTQAEYNALTPAEKMNGTMYFITDASGGGGGGGSSEIYDDTERVIGTYFGETLYKKTIRQTNIDGSPSDWTLIETMSDVDKYVKSEANFKRNNMIYSQYYVSIMFDNSTKGLYYYIREMESGVRGDLEVTVYYTKSST